MIQIAESTIDIHSLLNQWPLNRFQNQIVRKMAASHITYRYASIQHLMFELRVRGYIVEAAQALEKSDAGFANFKNARCNPSFWRLTEEGGFRIRNEVAPSLGILDIFQDGERYAFECTTAIVIVLYKAVLDALGSDIFDSLFAGLYLWNGNYDKDLGLNKSYEFDELPGDVRYIKNPQVDPDEMEWQGENLVVLGEGSYYGHGIGIGAVQNMIAELNRHRVPNAVESAYLVGEVLRPDFQYLSSYGNRQQVHFVLGPNHQVVWDHLLVAQIGSQVFIYI
ncbi:protein-glutamine gamma-glutamyltransferase [Ammoniphilus resinae]|uniref:Protein-glutamine gamma-glutamyltransferase n=1 Tax=Ammoniphilus resinae TaxID=861532 RepID=A0ABS4GN34_9BACL|nr:protein-glutamine gamma-glutamyltransferase [Ammoniphilus resinae]MBP1931697.1 protein-glutamine gamma-glutamyltransferase [Ammoniphilus resinae]